MDPDQHFNALNKHDMLHWYRIEAILGQGGFGITYLAKDTNLDQQVAIKEYLPSEFSTRDQANTVQPISENHAEIFDWGKKRFLDEAKTLAQFRHPNVVRVTSFFENNNTGYMVMEYEKGKELAAMIKAGETFDEQGLLDILLPILDGLDEVHAQGFIHRDIKPANIFIRHDGSPVLIDFGSARQAISGQTRTMTSLVTPGFAPFEQYHDAEGKQGPWTDIYALGATAYSMITGKPPVDAVKRGMARLDHSTDAYLELSDVMAGKYSDHLLRAIDRALEFREFDRPQTVTQWREMLIGEVVVPQADIVTRIAAPASAPAQSAPDKGADANTSIEQTELHQPDIDVATQVVESDAPKKRKLWPVLLIIAVLGGGLALAMLLIPTSSQQAQSEQVSSVEETPPEAVITAKPVESTPALESSSDEAAAQAAQQQAQIAAEQEKLAQEKARFEAEKLKLQAEQQRLALEKQQKDALALQQAEARKKQQEAEKKLKAAQAAEQKRQQLAKQKEEERKRQAELALQAEQARLEQQARAASESASKVVVAPNFNGLFVPEEGFEDLKLSQRGNRVKGKYGNDGSTLEGEIVGRSLIFTFNHYNSQGFRSGTGEFTMSDDGNRLNGFRSGAGFLKGSKWDLTRQQGGTSTASKTLSAQDVSGSYIPDEGFEELELQQKGDKITGIIGHEGSTLSGTRKGDTITFVFRYSLTGFGFKDGYGKFKISADGKRLTGTRSRGGFANNSSWNLTRKSGS